MNITKQVVFILLCLLSVIPVVHAEVTQRDIGPACVKVLGPEAEDLTLDQIVAIQTNGLKKELLLLRGPYSHYNGTVLLLLRDSKKCDVVLSTEARGVEFKFLQGKSLPNILTYSSEGSDDNGIMITNDETFVWDGKKYKEKTQ